jgi:hypothetical protein
MSGETVEEFRYRQADARAALRMIREVVEQHAPTGKFPPRTASSRRWPR